MRRLSPHRGGSRRAGAQKKNQTPRRLGLLLLRSSTPPGLAGSPAHRWEPIEFSRSGPHPHVPAAARRHLSSGPRPEPAHGRVPDTPVAGGRAVHRYVLVAIDALVVPDRALVRRRGRAPRGRLPFLVTGRRGAAARRAQEPGPGSAAGAPRPAGRAGAARGGQEVPGPRWPRRGSGGRGRGQRGDAAPAEGDHRGRRRIRLGLGGVGKWGRAVAHPVSELLRVGHPGDRQAQERRVRPAVPPVGAREGARAPAPEAGYGSVGRIR